ncbi:hypothetical protein PsorP6_009858 [Peronosclerospora sorghi]|uniref:Uncharacterized protein n=1 Tax=Peronosclerospora sorghi TaxID=230839 RepID=A0ACC0VYI0_9STRA|nr:hypothetical protein PsorP6_009858 [Peronosclerospora sorghi]
MRSNDKQKIIVAGIPKTLDNTQLSDLFSKFGTVAEAQVVLDDVSKTSRGFGFVTFTATSAMRAAIKNMHRKVLEGRTLNVRQILSKERYQKQTKDIPDPSKRLCWLLRKGKCTKGSECPFSHVVQDGEFGTCFNFKQTGECKHGEKCKFIHSKPNEETETNQQGSEETLKRASKVETKKRVCYGFQHGRCHRGQKCFFAHEMLEMETNVPTNVEKKANMKRRREETDDDEMEKATVPSIDHVKQRRLETSIDAKEREGNMMKKTMDLTGLAAHVRNFVAHQKSKAQEQKRVGPPKSELETKVHLTGEEHEENDRQVHDKALKRPVTSDRSTSDGVRNHSVGVSGSGSKTTVNKETMRATRDKLMLERRSKRLAKKKALLKLKTKGEVELEA